MKLGKVRLYPLTVFVSLLIFYLIATDSHGWYIYVLLGFIVLERSFLQFLIWMLFKAQAAMARQLLARLNDAKPFAQEKL